MGPGNDLFGSAGTEKGFHVQRVDLAAFAKLRAERGIPLVAYRAAAALIRGAERGQKRHGQRLPKRKKSLKHGRLIHAGRAAEHVYPPFGHVGGKRGKPLRLLAQTGQVGRGERNNDAGTPPAYGKTTYVNNIHDIPEVASDPRETKDRARARKKHASCSLFLHCGTKNAPRSIRSRGRCPPRQGTCRNAHRCGADLLP